MLRGPLPDWRRAEMIAAYPAVKAAEVARADEAAKVKQARLAAEAAVRAEQDRIARATDSFNGVYLPDFDLSYLRLEESSLWIDATDAPSALAALHRALADPPVGHELGYLGVDCNPALRARTLKTALKAIATEQDVFDFSFDAAGNLTGVYFENADNDSGAYHLPFILMALAPFYRAGSYTEWQYGGRPWKPDEDRFERFRVEFDGTGGRVVDGEATWSYSDKVETPIERTLRAIERDLHWGVAIDREARLGVVYQGTDTAQFFDFDGTQGEFGQMVPAFIQLRMQGEFPLNAAARAILRAWTGQEDDEEDYDPAFVEPTAA